MTQLPSGTVTFFFTDVEGSTQLFERLGDRYGPLLEAHDAIIRAALADHGGVEVKTEGDAFFAAFASAREGVAAALDAQLRLRSYPWPEDALVRVRMGLHTGEAQPLGGDYRALAVNLAARVSAAAHGEQVLISGACAEACGDSLPDGASLAALGRYRFKGFADPVSIAEVRHPGLAAGHPAPRALPAAAHNFRADRTSFLGREQELSMLTALLGETQLLTLTGPGGAGKTRLSKELALRTTTSHPDGSWFVDLAPLKPDDDISAEVALAVGLRLDPGTSLAGELEERRLLLVLDNCEHVLDQVAPLVDDLLARGGPVRILATSRERLAVDGEVAWPVPPLAESDAVRLFADRARRANVGVVMEQDEESVASICRSLYGLPLAVELAASRMARGLTPRQILERLEQRFDLLDGGTRTARPRQQTLRATIEWSFDLLAKAERAALRRTAVFSGSFTLEAAEAVVHGQRIRIAEVAPLLGALADKSLIVLEEEGRFRLLESIREYARLQLEVSGEAVEAFGRHLDWALSTTERRDEDATYDVWFDRLETDYLELRAAMDWGVAHGRARDVLELCVTAGQFLTERWHAADGSRLLRDALGQLPDIGSRDRARALARLGAMEWRIGDQAAISHFEEGLRLADEAGDIALGANIRVGYANTHLSANKLSEAAVLYQHALEAAFLEGLADVENLARSNLAYAYTLMGELDQASDQLEKLLELAGDEPRDQAYVYTGLFDIALLRGDIDAFRESALEALRLHVDCENHAEVAYAVNAVAAASSQGARDRVLLLAAARNTHDQLGVETPPLLAVREERVSAELRAELGEATFAELWTEGVEAGLAHACGLAERLLSSRDRELLEEVGVDLL